MEEFATCQPPLASARAPSQPSPEDGTFWMSFDTFQKGVSQVYICRLYHNPPTKDSLWCMALDEGMLHATSCGLDSLRLCFAGASFVWKILCAAERLVMCCSVTWAFRLPSLRHHAGKWVGPGACGANCLQGVQYAVISAKTTSVFIWLEQNDHMYALHSADAPLQGPSSPALRPILWIPVRLAPLPHIHQVLDHIRLCHTTSKPLCAK